MKLKIKYFDNNIVINDEKVNVLEIENKKTFYRLVRDLYEISSGNEIEDVKAYTEENTEINLKSKIKIVTDYFNFELNSKKTMNDISKYITSIIDSQDKILMAQKKLIQAVNNELNKIDLPLCVTMEQTIESIMKSLKISIRPSNELLDNLLLMIDLEKILKVNTLLVFINLKQYLSTDELNELYKYAIYNGLNIILIDSINYGVTKKYESKLIIDNNLDEFML